MTHSSKNHKHREAKGPQGQRDRQFLPDRSLSGEGNFNLFVVPGMLQTDEDLKPVFAVSALVAVPSRQ